MSVCADPSWPLRRWLGLSLALMIGLGAVSHAVAGARDSAVVLMYHRFGESEHPSTNVRLEQFEAHLEYLAEDEFNVWPLERIVTHLREGRALPDRTVAITIDDACRSVYEEAYPRLKERGWPFTVFVATEDVDRDVAWSLSWDQVREMAGNGAVIANHSHGHGYLARRPRDKTRQAWSEALKADIVKAQERLEEELGTAPPPLFAYPYGEYSREVVDVVKTLGFEAAFGQHSGALGPYSDWYALPRYAINERFGEMSEFRTRVESLHFPAARIAPWEPVLTEDRRRPRLAVEVAEEGPRLEDIQCFVSGQGGVEVEWLNRDLRRFAVRAPEPLPRGRSRYNCTAPSGEPGRFHWLGRQWLLP